MFISMLRAWCTVLSKTLTKCQVTIALFGLKSFPAVVAEGSLQGRCGFDSGAVAVIRKGCEKAPTTHSNKCSLSLSGGGQQVRPLLHLMYSGAGRGSAAPQERHVVALHDSAV